MKAWTRLKSVWLLNTQVMGQSLIFTVWATTLRARMQCDAIPKMLTEG